MTDPVTLFPFLSTEHAVLEPVPFGSGIDRHAELLADHPGCLPEVDVFVDLYCPDQVGAIALQLAVTAAGRTSTGPTGEPVGYATLMDLDPHAQHVRAGVWVDPCAGEHVATAARLLALNVAFATWNLRKVYTWEVHDDWAWTPPAGVCEGTLRRFLHQDSHHLDMDVVATSRQDWDRLGAPRVEELLGQ